MKRLVFSVLATLLCIAASAFPEDGFDFGVIQKQNHPRLFLDKTDFAKIKKDVKSQKNDYIICLHESMLKAADEALGKDALEYKKDESGRRILHVSRSALKRVSACAYAYRLTGNKAYLNKAESDLVTVCSFDDWNPYHFLDVAEMSLAVAIGYDWLYDKLKASTRALIEETLQTHAFETRYKGKEQVFFTRTNNWNQVCNAGLISACIAVYDVCPDVCSALLDKCIKSNRNGIKEMYAPDGAYPEGAGYWDYGTSFQTVLLCALEKAFGTDFGISAAEGFLKTGDYQLNVEGNTRKYFNYSDSGLSAGASVAMWYFASKTGNPSLLYREVGKAKAGLYSRDRLLFLAIKYASMLNADTIPEPDNLLYSAEGENPVVFARSGWGEKDCFIGLKGGSASANHAHMDAGSFVFEAYGKRWAMDYTHPSYSKLEVELRPFHEGLFLRSQDALRWQIYGYNNRQHNTLTINDRDHNVNGTVSITKTIQNDDLIGAEMDYGKVFFDEVESATRSVCLKGKNTLLVTDSIKAATDKPSHVRWTMVTEAKPEVQEDGIILTMGSVRMKLSASGAKVKYTTWPGDAKAYKDNPTRNFTQPREKANLVGFEYDIPAGNSASVTTVLERLNK